MTAPLGTETDPPEDDTPKVACYSVVRTAGGTIGSVIGFYRPETDRALIEFSDGGSARSQKVGARDLPRPDLLLA